MSTNPLNDISKVYLEQVASQEVEEGYQPIGREKESAMYRRAGNLARTSLASTGKTKLAAAKKSATIVGAITRQKEKERFDSIGQSPSHNEEAKPDYLDFDKDGNKKESMKKALRDKAKKKNLDEAGGRHGGGSMVGQPGGPSPRNQKSNDGNLANNYPPYDKVTRGDVIAGRLGKDEMGGKKKSVKEGYSNWREDLREVMSSVEKKDNDVKITEKKVENKIKTSAMGGGITLPEAIENLGGTLLEMVELDEKAESEQQQKLFGLALSVKRGQTPRSEVSDAVLKIVDTMSEKKIRDFAKTKHEGIPKKVEEAVADITPMSPQELQATRQRANLDKRIAALRSQSLQRMKKPEAVSGTTQEVQKESAADKALAMVKASMGSGLMTGKEKPAKLTAAQKEAREKAAAAYQKRTSDYLHSSPRD